MKNKNKQKIIIINLLLFVLLFALVTLNKEFFRPEYAHTAVGGILTGSFPNFIAAYIISLALMNAVMIRAPKHSRKIVYIIAVMVFAILTAEELYPMWGASTHYDPFDIIANGIGALAAILTYKPFREFRGASD